MRDRVDYKNQSKKTADRITCPHCGEKVVVNGGSILGKRSGESRKGESVLMRELVEKRWQKLYNNKSNDKSNKHKDSKIKYKESKNTKVKSKQKGKSKESKTINIPSSLH